MKDTSLLGKSAIVTGASSEIGGAIAIKLAQRGAAVILTYNKNRGGADAAARRVRRITNVPVVVRCCDVTRRKDIAGLIACAREVFGSVDILVNNAGYMATCGFFDDLPDQDHKTWAINVDGPLRLIRAVLPDMRRRRFGRIINISSTTGLVGSHSSIMYGMTKAALNALTKCVAKKFGKYHITANAIAASAIDGGMFPRIPAKRRLEVVRESAL
jgi:NAD(P)-dependent dehydrogenase (short-subunit alcohol dehydrogenase family)